MFCLPFKNSIFKSSTSKNTWQKNYIPKDATQQDIFLSKYPKYDGRGIKIAIIDSGFDVSLDGLQRTSESHPKILDCFDFTGVGNVDTSVIKEAEKNILIGLSGKKLKIPTHWINPSGKWHIGLKSFFKPTMSENACEISKKLPEIDCIVWFDGNKWCACLETFRDQKKVKVLTNFRDEHEYSILRLENLDIAYCITVHNDGNLLEIFMSYDDHGSVVAQTAAAHFPENRENDGLAPGAQIFLMSIFGPETDSDERFLQALNKALLKCIELNVDIINCSFKSFLGDEKISELINKIVKQNNTLIFKSAGNYGPFYATILKCDSCVENVIFRIGAAITFEIKKRIYNVPSTLNNHPPIISELSSRGPGSMGSLGLDFVAPGAVVTDDPRFSYEKRGAYSGTSIAAPNAAGAVACLLSGLKANSIEYSTKMIKFVLAKTANLPKNRNKFEFGHGLIQIYDAFEYCQNHSKIDFNNKIPYPLPSAGGIHFMQNDDEKNTVTEREINLSQFIENDEPSKDVIENCTLEISPKTAENFIEFDGNNKFKLKIDTKDLEAGSLNFAEILIMDSEIGSIYNIPINVIYVLKVTKTHNYRFEKEITLNYENPYYLILYPYFESSTECKITITTLENSILDLCIKYMVRSESGEIVKVLDFIPNVSTQTHTISIEIKAFHEFCIFQKIGALPFVVLNLKFNFISD